MTTSSIRVIYRSPADRLAARLGRALVRWADSRTARSLMTHERRANQIERELALIERERASLKIQQFHA
jgi:hypothetical protein